MARVRSGVATSRGLAARIQQLDHAIDLVDGRVERSLIDDARAVLNQAEGRLAISGDYTVVALAGSTGSGKSSLFNALVGQQLAEPGQRRPTTSEAMSVTWGDPPEDLLDWLGVRRRHALPARPGRDQLVLLDLPDHDSTEVRHRIEAERLIGLVDAFVWVVDPQKYADSALHDQYLKPMASHASVMVVVLNQIDRLSRSEADACLADLRRLLASEGLATVPVHGVSAVTGLGLPHLERELDDRMRTKAAAAARLTLDVRGQAATLLGASGDGATSEVQRSDRRALVDSFADAAGVPVVVDAVDAAWRRRGGIATGWPALTWIAKFKPDPLRRLRLDRMPALRGGRKAPELAPTAISHTSLTSAGAASRAKVDQALRAVAEAASGGLSRGWSDRIRQVTTDARADLPDQLDVAVAGTNLQMDRRHRWWGVVRVLQWILLLSAVAGLVWLGVDFLLAYLRLPPLPDYRVPLGNVSLPLPSALVVGGVLGGLALSGLSRIGVVLGAGRAASNARRALRRSVELVARREVLDGIDAELGRHAEATSALRQAAS